MKNMSEKQKQALALYNEHGSFRKVAEILGVTRQGATDLVKRASGKVSMLGEVSAVVKPNQFEETPYVFQGMPVTGMTTLVKTQDDEGKQVLNWIKTKASHQGKAEALQALVDGFTASFEPLPPPSEPSSWSFTGKTSMICIGDAHIGMYAHARESGENWDVSIAERVHKKAISDAIKLAAVESEKIIIYSAGDLYHYDNVKQETTRSGHRLDADGRSHKMIEAVSRIVRGSVDMARSLNMRVVLVLVPGNHDDIMTRALNDFMRHLYLNDDKVEVLDCVPSIMHYVDGNVLHCFSHGHEIKPGQMPKVCASQFPRLWGNATYRYGHQGHVHHASFVDSDGMLVRTYPTLAPRDAYAAGHGYCARRELTLSIYNKDVGLIKEFKFHPEE